MCDASSSVRLCWRSPGAPSARPAPEKVQGKTPDGTIEMHEAQAAYIGSGSGGNGVLFFRGREYPFDVGGLGVGGIGVSTIEATGAVYNLRDLGTISRHLWPGPLRLCGRQYECRRRRDAERGGANPALEGEAHRADAEPRGGCCSSSRCASKYVVLQGSVLGRGTGPGHPRPSGWPLGGVGSVHSGVLSTRAAGHSRLITLTLAPPIEAAHVLGGSPARGESNRGGGRGAGDTSDAGSHVNGGPLPGVSAPLTPGRRRRARGASAGGRVGCAPPTKPLKRGKAVMYLWMERGPTPPVEASRGHVRAAHARRGVRYGSA